MIANVRLRGWPSLLDLLAFVQVAGGRQHDAAYVSHGMLHCVLQRERGTHIVAGDEASMHVTGANTQFEDDGSVAGLGERESMLHGAHDRREVGSRIEQPDLRLHRESMRPLLHDAGAFAVVLSQ